MLVHLQLPKKRNNTEREYAIGYYVENSGDFIDVAFDQAMIRIINPRTGQFALECHQKQCYDHVYTDHGREPFSRHATKLERIDALEHEHHR